MMRRSAAFFSALLLGATLLAAAPARAALPELRIAPLRYDAHLEPGQPKDGVIDASNPTGSTIHVAFQVQAFRQINDSGELEFYDDEKLAAAVTPAVSEFDLAPRQAIRTRFTIDPANLGQGGAYGAIFLRTTGPNAGAGQINTSARVGTLLILDVGSAGTKSGRIMGLSTPRFIYGGHHLAAHFNYSNTGRSALSLAFAPNLNARAGWSGAPSKLTGRFVFPGRTRGGSITLPLGNTLGPVPVTISDTSGGSAPVTRWVFVVTGFWTWVLPLLLLFLLGLTPVQWWRKPGLHLSPN